MNQPMLRQLFSILCISIVVVLFTILISCSTSTKTARITELFNNGWKFYLGDVTDGQEPGYDDFRWRNLDLPHDWSIEGEFSSGHPATPGGGALPGGIGWYRKHFTVPEADQDKLVFIEFDGVYRNSEVWLNGHFLGKRPYGYSSFRYELTPFLHYGETDNIMAVKVDNSQQPNSRWYSGSGIYRNVRLVTVEKIHVDHWGTFITTPEVAEESAEVSILIKVRNASDQDENVVVKSIIKNKNGRKITAVVTTVSIPANSTSDCSHNVTVPDPMLWSIETPHLYKAMSGNWKY